MPRQMYDDCMFLNLQLIVQVILVLKPTIN